MLLFFNKIYNERENEDIKLLVLDGSNSYTDEQTLDSYIMKLWKIIIVLSNENK